MYTEHKPDTSLGLWVECTWSISTSSAVYGYPVRPDGCMDLIYTPGRGVEVVGAMTREQRYDFTAGESRVGLRFRPGMARPFMGIDAGELIDRLINYEEVAGPPARDLRKRLEEARSNEERRGLLLGSLRAPAAPDPIHRAIDAMTRLHGGVDVDEVADQAGMSARQFRRRCREEAGLGPKHLARVLRFRRACDLAARGESWLRVAVEAGYFDQAHMIRDFREFTGATPVSVFSKTE